MSTLDRKATPLDIAMAVLSVALVGGFYVDLWAHSHGRVDETFFTPWHGLLYASAGLIGGVLLYFWLRGRREGNRWRDALPFGYGLSIIGAALFLLAGLGDLAWHEAFGFEEEVEDLLSPTHLLLATSGIFMVAGPVRASWKRGPAASFPAWLVWALPVTMLLSILTAFTSYAHPAVDTWPAAFPERPVGDSTLEIVDTSTGSSTRVRTEVDGAIWLPSTTPDGRIVVSVAKEDGGALVLMNVDGSEPTTLWEGPGIFNHPDVSPDGTKVAFTAEVGDTAQIHTIPLTGGDATQLTDLEGFNWGPSWSPDGTQIVFASFVEETSNLFIVNSSGSDVSQLTNLAGNEGAPDWSPTGDLIAFEGLVDENLDIYTVRVDGSDVTRLTSDGSPDLSPSWSSDGETIAFSSSRDRDYDLYLMGRHGEDVTKLTDDPTSDIGWAGTSFAADDSFIATNSAGWDPWWFDRVNRDVRAIVSMLIQAALLAGTVLLILRHGPMPLGGFTLVMTVNGALMTVFADNYWYVIPALAAGLAGDVLMMLLRGRPRTQKIRVVLFMVLAIWYSAYLIAVTIVEGELGWRIHMTAGAPLLAGAVGLLLSLVVFPAAETDTV